MIDVGDRYMTTRRHRARRRKLDTDYSMPDKLDADDLGADNLDAEIIRRCNNSSLSNSTPKTRRRDIGVSIQ